MNKVINFIGDCGFYLAITLFVVVVVIVPWLELSGVWGFSY